MSKEHPVEQLTRADFEQILQDHTDRVIFAVEKVDTRVSKLEQIMNKRFDEVIARIESA